jgi:murein DD-endopeptidase MepM/ murein hydrolase activator NlpD
VTVHRRLRGGLSLFLAVLLVLPSGVLAADRLSVSWRPAKPRVGDAALLQLRGAPEGATIEGMVDGRPLAFFPYADGHAALVGFDLEVKPGPTSWQLAVLEPLRDPRTKRGSVHLLPRQFPVQRLSLPTGMVDLDPETERRAVSEGERLQTLYRTITPQRLWRGVFTRPVGGSEAGTGFGARRIINGKPRMPHGGADYAAPTGTPVVAVNSGRVALVGDFFFPGRLVAIDHGLGLYTLYFHLDSVAVNQGDPVERGQTIGAVGATGRATGPHLHFGAHVAGARIDPATLLLLKPRD